MSTSRTSRRRTDQNPVSAPLVFDVRSGLEDLGCPRVVDYPDAAAGKLSLIPKAGTSERVTDAACITIQFDYPLRQPVAFTFESPTGFTLLDLFRCVHEGYTRVYAAEPDPGALGPSLLNRAASAGPYGIWGHYIDDLFLEGLIETEPGRFALIIGS